MTAWPSGSSTVRELAQRELDWRRPTLVWENLRQPAGVHVEALAGEHLHAADDRGTGGDLVEPALQVRMFVPVDALVLP